jgi:hypothetical protein
VASSPSSVLRRPARRDLVGVETPRIFTPPLRPLTPKTSLGFACIDFAEEVVGFHLLPWQKWLLIHALELLPDGTFRYRTVILLVARQNGKSTVLQLLGLFFMYVRGAPLVIGTAQNLDIAEEVWQGAVDIAEDVPELAAEIKNINRTNGKKALELVKGERYKVQAANRRGGRGLSGDLVLMDELREHQSWDAWAAVTKTTLARAHAQVWAASNAGDAASIVLRHLRLMAHEALGDPDNLREQAEDTAPDQEVELDTDDSLGIFEWSAPAGCDIDDRDGWIQANPSLGHTITERALGSARRTDPEWVFRTEVLCQWSSGSLEGPFPAGTWEAGTDPESFIPEGGTFVFGIDVSWDRSTAYVSVAGFREDGLPHVEVVAQRVGTDWVVPWLLERRDTEGLAGLVIQAKGAPVSSLLDDLKTTEIPLIEWSGSSLGPGTGAFYDLVRIVQENPTQGVRHRPQPVLDVAASTARTRPLGDSWVWDRKNSPTDIAPLVACTGAVWALSNLPEDTTSVYETRGMAVL